MSNLIFCLMGPTASGKTGLACELVQNLPLEIISVDSALIYREMNIGTAKPTQQELELAPHHLIDIKDPNEAYSAADFCTDVKAISASILKKGKYPLLVGGTMMYFNALQKGLSVLPEANELIRKQLEEEAEQKGWDFLYQKLVELDPETAQRIHAHDTQRLQRALEVFYITGTPLSTLLTATKEESNYRFVTLALFPENRRWLHDRIALRFDQMLAAGFVEEVRQLLTKWDLPANIPSMRCVGYRQVLEFLNNEYDYATMRDKGIAASRQLAKRQLTWLRSWDNVSLYDPENKTFNDEIMAKVTEILDNEAS